MNSQLVESNKEAQWQTKTFIYEKAFPIYYAPNVYNHEITKYMTQFSDTHTKNQIIAIFG